MTVKQLKELYDGLNKRLDSFDKHFTNHLSNHKWDRILTSIYFLAVVIMFSYVKWGI